MFSTACQISTNQRSSRERVFLRGLDVILALVALPVHAGLAEELVAPHGGQHGLPLIVKRPIIINQHIIVKLSVKKGYSESSVGYRAYAPVVLIAVPSGRGRRRVATLGSITRPVCKQAIIEQS